MNEQPKEWGSASGDLPEAWNQTGNRALPEAWGSKGDAPELWSNPAAIPQPAPKQEIQPEHLPEPAPSNPVSVERMSAGKQSPAPVIPEDISDEPYSESAVIPEDAPFVQSTSEPAEPNRMPQYTAQQGSMPEADSLPMTLRDPYEQTVSPSSKASAWKLIVPAAAVVAGGAVLLGVLLTGQNRSDSRRIQNTASDDQIDQITEVVRTSAEKPQTSERAQSTAAAELTEPEQARPAPTVSNAYLYYVNTGAGCKLFLHIEGTFFNYHYQCFYKTPSDSDYCEAMAGSGAAEEMLLEEGLGGYGIESYKALITVWNADQSASAEQWVYVDLSKSDDGGTEPEVSEPDPVESAAMISDARIVGIYTGVGGGYDYELDVTGDYSYWIAEVKEVNDIGEISTHTAYSSDMVMSDYPFIAGGSTIEELSAVVTPYDQNGVPGKPYTVKWNPKDIELYPSGSIFLFNGYIATKNEELNLRSYPNTDSTILAKIPKGTEVDIYESYFEGWYITYYNGKYGYVSADYIGRK